MDHQGRLHVRHRDPPAAPVIGGRSRTIALWILCLCALTTGIDMTITNVALPFIGTSLDAQTNGLQWTVDAYNIMLAGLLVLGGALADRYGRRRVFLLGYSLFAVASTCAAFSPSIEALIVCRAVMGMGAAGVSAPALAIIASMYAPEERGGAISAFVVFGATGLAIGPIAGGLLLDHFWWGSVFLVTVPIIVVGVILGARTIRESRAPEPAGGRPRLDIAGAALSVVGLAAFLFGIIEGPTRGWDAPLVVAGLIGGGIVIALFVRRELRARAPLFDVRILGRPAVATGAITLVLAYMLFNGFLFLNPQYLQGVEDESIVTVGLALVPFALVFGLCSLRAPALLERIGPRSTLTIGLGVSAVACVLFAIALGGSLWSTIGASVVLGAGLSLLIAPPSTVVMNDVPPSKAGDGSSLNFVSRFVGASLGIAIVGSLLATIYARDVDPALSGLDASQAEQAQGSLQGALTVANSLDATAGSSLTNTARDAFNSGAAVAYIAVAVLGVLAAGWSWVALGRAAPGTPSPATRANS
jgi:EmrB/QacA subfamily drug resistance transporter